MNKTLKGLIFGLLLFVFLTVSFYGYRYWQIKTGRILKVGNTWVTHEAFHEQYGDPQNPVAVSKNTPEEVYTKFRTAILANNVEEALKYITPEKVDKYKIKFANETIMRSYKGLPSVDKIRPEDNKIIGNYISYNYFKIGDEKTYSVSFVKNQQGYWLIELI
ncbi:MAG: hypothetical protein WCG01_04685 [bacterium]